MAWYQIIAKNKIRFFLHEPFDPLRNWLETNSDGMLQWEEEYETFHAHPAFQGIFSSNTKVLTYTAVKPGCDNIRFRFSHLLDPYYDLNVADFTVIIAPDLSVRVYECGESIKDVFFSHYSDEEPILGIDHNPANDSFTEIESVDPCLALQYIPKEDEYPSQSLPGDCSASRYAVIGVRPGQGAVRFRNTPDPEPIIAAFTVLDDLSVRLDGMIKIPAT